MIREVGVGNRNRQIRIIENNGATRLVGPFRLHKYPENETIKQNTDNGINYDSNFAIETYDIDN